MSQTERIHQIVHILETSRHPVPIKRFLEALEISRATFKRDLEYLRDRLGAPIEWQPGTESYDRGYVLAGESPAANAGHFGIQGLWFNQSEIHALLMMHQLASNMDPGLISDQTEALLTRIRHLLGHAEDDPQEVLTRIQIIHSAGHRPSPAWFQLVAKATMQQRRLLITYYTRSRDTESDRLVSPKRLLHYRENWYLLAWCHTAQDLRLFSLDAVRHAQIQAQNSRPVAKDRLDDFVSDGFGIFSGKAKNKARLKFTAESARWVKDETWHPDQQISWEGESLILEVPYSHEAELIMEVFRHGANVEVLSPKSLRHSVASTLSKTLALYA